MLIPNVFFRLVILSCIALACSNLIAQEFDLVLRGGRVMDPESGLDAIRDLGISNGKIVAISKDRLKGKEMIEAKGLVVAPGFIDVHQHAWDDETIRFKIQDGVTSILELEVGTDDIDQWYQKYQGKLPLNYGVSIGHIKVRMKVMGDFPSFLPKSDSKAATVSASDEEIAEMKKAIAHGLDQGAVAVGFGLYYTPAATRTEIQEMFRAANDYRAPCHVHLRGRGDGSIAAIDEMITASAKTGAPVQIVHLQSTGSTSTPTLLQMVSDASSAGVPVSAEVYPWTAGMTDIKSAIFADGWQKNFNLDYQDLQWGETGERLTKETFLKYREAGGLVIVHSNTEEIVTAAVTHPLTMIASDGLMGHPRNAGTFARVLGFYVREKEEIDLMTALKKITLMPAQQLEERVPAMKNKGRIHLGADADLTLFDPASVSESATFTDAKKPSQGIPHVIVNGIPVIRDSKPVESALPGQAIRAEIAASE